MYKNEDETESLVENVEGYDVFNSQYLRKRNQDTLEVYKLDYPLTPERLHIIYSNDVLIDDLIFDNATNLLENEILIRRVSTDDAV